MYEQEELWEFVQRDTASVEFRTRTPEIFDFLLQEGFQVACVDSCSVREFLCIQLELCGDYTEKNIQTIFLNGRPVDDVDTAILHESDRLALSAAMPGLVGATMRKRGFFAKMRHSISHDFNEEESAEENEGKQCFVTVKLFNLLARDLARDFLRRGIRFPMARFRTLIDRRSESFWGSLEQVLVNGELLATSAKLADSLLALPDAVSLRLLETER